MELIRFFDENTYSNTTQRTWASAMRTAWARHGL
jgi:hypothetical protein